MPREIVVRPDQVEAKSYTPGRLTRHLMGQNGEGHMAYINEIAPNNVIPPHFHDCEQFMVILKGSGTLAGDALTPGTLQYTEAKTPYGPIVAGPDGLTFMVIRPHTTHDDKGVPISETIERVRAAQSRM